MVNAHAIAVFQTTVLDYYHHYGRHDMPWRQPEVDGSFDPYKIMVSEIMLQQTQVSRVIPIFQRFMEQFPSIASLSEAPLGEVMQAWSGLGYNRRAKFLHHNAQRIYEEFDDKFPTDLEALVSLPGIGQNTAGAILAYAFDQPAVFIETNIRTVFIHHFFQDKADVSDAEIRALIAASLPRTSSREWYWALMDYGAHLKQTVGNPNQASKHYAKQSPFEGSQRQLRGRVIHLLARGQQTRAQLQAKLADDRLDKVLNDLLKEKLIQQHDRQLSL